MNTRNEQGHGTCSFVAAGADDRGLSTVEYVVLLVLVVGAAVALWVNIRQDIRDKLTMVNDSFAAVAYKGGSAQSSGPAGGASPANPPAAAAPAFEVSPAPAALSEGAPTKTKEDR